LEPDGLIPSGTFVEFEWHSFDSDGDLDAFPGTIGSIDSPGRLGTLPKSDLEGEAQAALERKEAL